MTILDVNKVSPRSLEIISGKGVNDNLLNLGNEYLPQKIARYAFKDINFTETGQYIGNPLLIAPEIIAQQAISYDFAARAVITNDLLINKDKDEVRNDEAIRNYVENVSKILNTNGSESLYNAIQKHGEELFGRAVFSESNHKNDIIGNKTAQTIRDLNAKGLLRRETSQNLNPDNFELMAGAAQKIHETISQIKDYAELDSTRAIIEKDNRGKPKVAYNPNGKKVDLKNFEKKNFIKLIDEYFGNFAKFEKFVTRYSNLGDNMFVSVMKEKFNEDQIREFDNVGLKNDKDFHKALKDFAEGIIVLEPYERKIFGPNVAALDDLYNFANSKPIKINAPDLIHSKSLMEQLEVINKEILSTSEKQLEQKGYSEDKIAFVEFYSSNLQNIILYLKEFKGKGNFLTDQADDITRNEGVLKIRDGSGSNTRTTADLRTDNVLNSIYEVTKAYSALKGVDCSNIYEKSTELILASNSNLVELVDKLKNLGEFEISSKDREDMTQNIDFKPDIKKVKEYIKNSGGGTTTNIFKTISDAEARNFVRDLSSKLDQSLKYAPKNSKDTMMVLPMKGLMSGFTIHNAPLYLTNLTEAKDRAELALKDLFNDLKEKNIKFQPQAVRMSKDGSEAEKIVLRLQRPIRNSQKEERDIISAIEDILNDRFDIGNAKFSRNQNLTIEKIESNSSTFKELDEIFNISQSRAK